MLDAVEIAKYGLKDIKGSAGGRPEMAVGGGKGTIEEAKKILKNIEEMLNTRLTNTKKDGTKRNNRERDEREKTNYKIKKL